MTPDEIADVLDGVVYADAFGSAATVESVWRYSRVAIARGELDVLLSGLAGEVVTRRDGVCCLRGREELLDRHADRARRAATLVARSRRVAWWLARVPFVRGVVLTGSAAAGSARQGADADLLVIVRRGRIGTVFLVLGSVARLTRRRLFCPNFYVAEDALAFAAGDLYVARELAQALPLNGCGDRLGDANAWVREVFPNVRPRVRPATPSPGVQRALEHLLGDRLERRAVRVARTRLEAHHARFGESVPAAVAAALAAGGSLRFHGVDVERGARARYAESRERLVALRREAR